MNHGDTETRSERDSLVARLSDVIQRPLQLATLWTSGRLSDQGGVKHFDSDYPDTPVALWFDTVTVIFGCATTIDVEFCEGRHERACVSALDRVEPLPPDDLAAELPLFAFLRTPFNPNAGFEDFQIVEIVLLFRDLGEEYDGLVAIVLRLQGDVEFGFSSVFESSFVYLFNEHCRELVEAAENSPNHEVRRIAGPAVDSSSVRQSPLWLVQ